MEGMTENDRLRTLWPYDSAVSDANFRACLRVHQIMGAVSHRKTIARTTQLCVEKYAIAAMALKNTAQPHRGATTAFLVTYLSPTPRLLPASIGFNRITRLWP